MLVDQINHSVTVRALTIQLLCSVVPGIYLLSLLSIGTIKIKIS